MAAGAALSPRLFMAASEASNEKPENLARLAPPGGRNTVALDVRPQTGYTFHIILCKRGMPLLSAVLEKDGGQPRLVLTVIE